MTILRPAFERLQEMGERSLLSTAASLLGHAACAMERTQEAEAFSIISEEAAAGDDLDSQVSWRAVRARALALRGDTESAERLIGEAIERVDRTDLTDLRAETRVDAAHVFRLAGRGADAAEQAEQAADLFAGKGNRAGEAKASALRAVSAAIAESSDLPR
jgi:hypothetical protein